jgi:beta-lactam-binding protein with PASTA domain/predicted Ser/Thr protein kinase
MGAMASAREGTVVDERYSLKRKIGVGGMADVWLAEDTELDREVAVKILHDRFAQDKEFVERFRREAQAAAGLQHPNVVSVFDRGEFGDTYFIAMEYVNGPSLKDLVKGGMGVQEAVDFTRQILNAARFAHRKGIVHRDFKPQNVLVDAEGRARVADFGIARGEASDITQTGSVMGTAQYLSPEQAQGRGITPRSDIYSIGVILYEALTGRVPFQGDSAVAVALKQVSETPRRPSAINPSVPPALDAVVMRALAKDPSRRFTDADAFLKALDAAERAPDRPRPEDTAAFAAVSIEGEPTAAREPDYAGYEDGEPRRRWGRWFILALLVAAVAAVIAFALTRPERVTVPNVTGIPVEAATARLDSVGLQSKIVLHASAAPRDQVVEQDPIAGQRVDKGDTITLNVSTGPASVKIPDVSGLTEGDASRKLTALGFRVDPSFRFSDRIPKGRVIGTAPEAGTSIPTGSTVKLLISSGTNKIEVPSLVGLQLEGALARLDAVGLGSNVVQRDDPAPSNQVIDQSPPAGSLVKKGANVTVFVSTGLIDVPGVIGQTRQAAVNTLKRAGFRVAVQLDSTASPSQAGIVTDQFPPRGSRAQRGDTVTITVGAPQTTTTTTTTTTTP